MSARTLWRQALLATLDDAHGWGLVEDGCVVTEGARIVWVGADAAVPAYLRAGATEHALGGALLTPGLVDCHTHLVYGGQRANEFEQRLQGLSYAEIARAGGGIRSTVAATRLASDASLLGDATRRAQALMAEGVTTLEIKSGYGLSERDEARCLRVARALGAAPGLTVRTTCLAAHAVPPEFEGRADDYLDAVCQWLPRLHAEGLVDAVDAYCETIAFTPAQTARLFEAARHLGLPVKLHAGQLSDQGGAELASAFGALSCDHLEYLGEAGMAAMAGAGTVAVLLPGAYYCLRDPHPPPVEGLRRHGIALAVASDHNPGTSPTLSLLLMLNMACTLFRLTPEEALRGATVNAARALGLHDRGRLASGQRADFVVWDCGHPNELAYWLGHNPCRRVVAGGRERAP